MHRPSLLSPPYPPPLPLLPCSRRSFLPTSAVFHGPQSTPFDSASLRPCFTAVPLSRPRVAIGTTECVGSSKEGEGEVQESEFIEVGYISTTNGIKGEVRVMATTDFPELRLRTPGTRWLRTHNSGKELIVEVQLTGGRHIPGKKNWVVSFSGIDTADKAKQIVGSTILVRECDRPDLGEDEFYNPDLVGMRVVLKESGTLVGTITNVIDNGTAGGLLHVMLANKGRQNRSSSSKLDSSSFARYIWIPFVEEIVPDVDMDKREMLITPPEGLLELNLRPDMRPKKERRVLEWRERKKLKLRLIPAKKKLAEMDQIHVLEGLKIGEKVQKNLLARQIASIDFKLFQHAIRSINKPFCSFSEFLSANSAAFLKSPIRVSHDYLINCASDEKGDTHYLLHKEGLQLLSKSKAAIIVIVNEKDHDGTASETNGVSKSSINQFENLLLGLSRSLKVEEQGTAVPLIVVSPAHLIQPYKECLLDNDYLGINYEKVWFLEELQLPIIGMPIDQNGGKILLKSPWEILQAPIGSGGIFELLLATNIATELNEIGVEYVQVCSLNDRATIGHPLFFGLVSSQKADVGIKIFEGSKGEDEFDMIFSLRQLKKLTSQIDKLQFLAVPEQHAHAEKDENELVTINPDAPNSYSLRCSIYSSLNICSPGRMCAMKVFE